MLNGINEVKSPATHIRRSLQNLSYTNLLTCDMGRLVPCNVTWLAPGDVLNLGHSVFSRFSPLLNPILSNLKIYVHDHVVPLRILMNEHDFDIWQTGGVSGNELTELPNISLHHLSYVLKTYNDAQTSEANKIYALRSGGLLDYLGIPVCNLYSWDSSTGTGTWSDHINDQENRINLIPVLAYALIYREYYLWNQDENSNWVTNKYLCDFSKLPMGNWDDLVYGTDADPDLVTFLLECLKLRYRGWQHDYFTSALPTPQRGDEVIINGASGSSQDSLTFTSAALNGFHLNGGTEGIGLYSNIYGSTDVKLLSGGDSARSFVPLYATGSVGDFTDNVRVKGITSDSAGASSGGQLNGVSIPGLSGFTINDLRTANALQVYLERNNRAGSRLKEYIFEHFNELIPDSRLDRPEFLGYTEQVVQVSEVLQTSQTTSGDDASVLGDQAGHAISASTGQSVHGYRVTEPMVQISLVSIMPESSYFQGLNKFWNKLDRYDFYSPEFAHLGEQEVKVKELMCSFLAGLPATPNRNEETFGYMPRWAEYKTSYNTVHGNFALPNNMMTWHMSRYFSKTVQPTLNQEFIDCKPTERIFPVVDNDAEYDPASSNQFNHHCYLACDNKIKVSRLMPAIADPSLNVL